MSDLNIETINFEKYKRRLESGNPVTIEELENELKVLIKEMIEAATQGELTTHLGYEKNEKSDTGNYRNGYNKKSLKSKYGEIEVNIPRDRNSTFVLTSLRGCRFARTSQS